MKRPLWIILALLGNLYAQTLVTGPNVSGTWTLSGSPYIIQNEITVAANDILTIQPGVQVKFAPSTRMEVYGELIATGTSNQGIVFEAVDTTSWSDENSPNGGWNGIHIHPYGGSGNDQTILNYCTLKDGKYGFASIQNYRYPLSIERGMNLQNCIVTHNRTNSGPYGAGAVLWAQLYIAGDSLNIDKCNFFANNSQPCIISIQGSTGYSTLTNSHIHHNLQGSGITGNLCRILIANNEFDHNDAIYDSAPLLLTTLDAIVRNNHIHHNVSPDHGGMTCNYGTILVENNFIHNNYQTNASCGFTEGGGGINITCYGTDVNNGFFIVRNNIIANNYSALGGAGINIYQAITAISNNHIINNYSPAYGKSIFIQHAASKVYMRSNIFYSQEAPGQPDTTNMIYIWNGPSVWFDYNFIPSGYSKSVLTQFSYTLYGDTSHNVISLDPGMVNPTPDNNYLTDAAPANFNLLGTSACINRGDTVGAFPALTDYAGNNRFVGIVDIGAYEYPAGESMGIEESNSGGIWVYPNPSTLHAGFHVSLPENEGVLAIYDLSGKQWFYRQVSQNTLWVDFRPDTPGIYILHFYGKKNHTQKLLVQ